VTLALRALPPAGATNPPGPWKWLQAFTHSWAVRMSTYPLVADGLGDGDRWRLLPSLALPFVPDLLADQRAGAAMVCGAVDEILMMIVLVQWSRTNARDAHPFDRRAGSDGDAELAAHNVLLARLAQRSPTRDNSL
jgi:hypothetical protein